MRERDHEEVAAGDDASHAEVGLPEVDLALAREPVEQQEPLRLAGVELGGELLADTVNLLFTICANESAPIALTYFHRFRQRFSTVFGYSVPLLSRGRSFSR